VFSRDRKRPLFPKGPSRSVPPFSERLFFQCPFQACSFTCPAFARSPVCGSVSACVCVKRTLEAKVSRALVDLARSERTVRTRGRWTPLEDILGQLGS